MTGRAPRHRLASAAVRPAARGPALPAPHAGAGQQLLDDLDAGRRRAAWPDPAAPGGWRVDVALREELLTLFRDSATTGWRLGGLLEFQDRTRLPTKRLAGGPWRIVPGGTSVRAGSYLGPGVVVMPPSFINVGAWIGEGAMVDSHVLVGSCAQVGARVHLAAGVQIGGVLEPPNARPVIIEDDVFVGAQCGLFDGVLVGRGAVLAAGTILTGTSRLYDLPQSRLLQGTPANPLTVPRGAVVVPAIRPAAGAFAAEHGIGLHCAAIVKQRDASTTARTAIEEALR
ncbi:MAG: 2,3,4,5-tetrahydropyridine-2,6-dicarboxylate N-succinyltransferase [Candidatus Limnocylindrales bacterium]